MRAGWGARLLTWQQIDVDAELPDAVGGRLPDVQELSRPAHRQTVRRRERLQPASRSVTQRHAASRGVTQRHRNAI